MFAARARIDLGALQHNLQRCRQLAPGARVMAVLKANAYGNGQLPVARALSAPHAMADAIGVARLEEALILRKGGIKQPIVLLEGFFSENDLPLLAEQQLETVIHLPEQVTALEQAKLAQPLVAWLKLDSGMHRIGVHHSELADCYARLKACPNISQVRLMSHFCCADDVSSERTPQQIQYFMDCIEGYDAELSLANSGGVVAWPDSHCDWVRPGILLHGVSPMLGATGADHDLRPVMTLSSSLISIRPLKKGEAVGYGATWRTPRDTLIGVAAIGYGDGYPRCVDEGTPVLINGRRYPLAGRVSMDMVTIDLGPNPDVALGDEVILWGEGLPVEEIAAKAGTIPYELLCNITRRVQFDYRD